MRTDEHQPRILYRTVVFLKFFYHVLKSLDLKTGILRIGYDFSTISKFRTVFDLHKTNNSADAKSRSLSHKRGSVRKMRIYNVKHFDTSLMRNYEVLI